MHAYDEKNLAKKFLAKLTIHNVDNIMTAVAEEAARTARDVFHVVDLSFFTRRLAFWRTHLPTVQPFYAIKTNHDGAIVATLADLGLGFDCASIKEVRQVCELGVAPDRLIFANPFKSKQTIDALKSSAVKTLVFDCLDELKKLLEHYPDARLVLRIATDDSHSAVRLSAKFGASVQDACALVDYAAAHGANLVGVSFHVGCNCDHADSYRKAIFDAAHVLDYARTRMNKPMSILDLGGGWPGANDDAFVAIAKVVNESLREVIAKDVRVIAEPGSFFATQSTLAAVRVIGQKTAEHEGARHQDLFLGSGVYGIFFSGYYHHYDPKALARVGWQFKPLSPPLDGTLHLTRLWGPTCDSTDKIVEGYRLPKQETGSWLYTKNIGAYASVMQNDFNQIECSYAIYVRT